MSLITFKLVRSDLTGCDFLYRLKLALCCCRVRYPAEQCILGEHGVPRDSRLHWSSWHITISFNFVELWNWTSTWRQILQLFSFPDKLLSWETTSCGHKPIHFESVYFILKMFVLFWNAGWGQSGTFLPEWWRQAGCFLFLRRRKRGVERRHAGEERQKVQVNKTLLILMVRSAAVRGR